MKQLFNWQLIRPGLGVRDGAAVRRRRQRRLAVVQVRGEGQGEHQPSEEEGPSDNRFWLLGQIALIVLKLYTVF